MGLLVAAFGIRKSLWQEAVYYVRFLRPSGPPLLGSRYHVYETEVASTLALTTLAMIITLPLVIVLIGA